MENILDIDIENKEEKKEMTAKEQKEIKLIIENLEFIKVLMRFYKGQVLYMDIKDFCLKYRIFNTEDSFEYAVEKLIAGKIIKKTIFPNTNYVVLIAKACVVEYFKENKDKKNKRKKRKSDSIEFSASQVRLNCFRNVIIIKNIKRPECSLDGFFEFINEHSTFLNTKYDIKSAYDFFNRHLELNESAEQSYKCALYRNTKGLKTETIGSEKDELEDYKNSLDTFVNMNIYTYYNGDKFVFYILDVCDNLNSEKTGKKVGMVVGTLYEQVKQLSMADKLDTIEFVIVTRDDVRHDKVIYSFRKTYYKEHVVTSTEDKNKKVVLIKAYKEYLLDAVNTASNKRVNSIKVEYTDKNKDSQDMFSFVNTYYTQYGLNLNISVLNAKLNDRLNMYTRIANVKQGRKTKQEKELEKKIRNKIENDIRKEIESKYILKEEEIRKQVMLEYGLPVWDSEEED